jgi:hypothetical protein
MESQTPIYPRYNYDLPIKPQLAGVIIVALAPVVWSGMKLIYMKVKKYVKGK